MIDDLCAAENFKAQDQFESEETRICAMFATSRERDRSRFDGEDRDFSCGSRHRKKQKLLKIKAEVRGREVSGLDLTLVVAF